MLLADRHRGTHRAAGPGGLRRAGRLRELLVTGVLDSFGMALGWTFIVLIGTARGGLGEAALYNAAMLVGTVLSAPAAGWLSSRLSGRRLLRTAAAVELPMRFLVLLGVISGLPSWLVAVLIVVMHTAAWAGYAGLRAEVTAVDASPRTMTRFVICIVGVEAAGTALAALLPVGADGTPTGWLRHAVFTVFLGTLLPVMVIARRARIAPSASVFAPSPARGRHARPGWRLPMPGLMLAGGGVMLVAAGPSLLAVPVTEELYGSGWVAGAALAFCAGTLLADKAIGWMEKLALPAVLRWALWGLGMLAGWILAPLYAPFVLLAQFSAGLATTAFEGDMDAKVAAEATPGTLTRDLAYSASVRALGGAIAVRALPMMIAAPAIGLAASTSALALGAMSLIAWAGLTTMPHLFRRATAPSRP
ncbi:hypothetical protein Ade02nite_03090 [Paractinoplanes deccanensis]|uniref:MFS transporter n=1 Tax=Paractinoplanes deccanensis TaxID=113561 RepID=A0ABQ3XV87_9ACTN|nr:hypothetical protein [Actinoplanes deccanensis]GID71668.1 hypothetical protein Ade02nite_03090 [Actinoplanes deccanensis]